MKNQAVLNNQQIEANKVLSNTYKLLGLNLVSAAIFAYLAMFFNVPMFHWLIVVGVHIGLLVLVEKTADSGIGLLSTFLFTGWLGFTAGPIVNYYIQSSGGTDIVFQALTGTALIFIMLSGWVHYNKTKMQNWGSFLAIGMLSAFILAILNVSLFQSSMLSLGLSIVFMFLSGAIMMYQTSQIIHGGETNYIRATVTLFVSIYNMFMSLLNILNR